VDGDVERKDYDNLLVPVLQTAAVGGGGLRTLY
jgi:hypothetical protein